MNPNESAMHLVQFFGESWRVLALLLPHRYVQASRENLLRDLPRWPITRVGGTERDSFGAIAVLA